MRSHTLKVNHAVALIVSVTAVAWVAVVVGWAAGALSGRPQNLEIVAAVTFTGFGAITVPRRPSNPVGWLLLGIGAAAAASLVTRDYSAWPPASWASMWLWWLPFGLLPHILLRFPDGRLPSPRWRAAHRLALFATVTPVLGLAVAAVEYPTDLLDRAAADRTTVARLALWVAAAGLLAAVAALVVGLAALGRRRRGSDEDTRKQLACLAVGGLSVLIGTFLESWGAGGGWLLVAVVLPATIAIGILKYRLYDIDLFLNRTLVYGLMTVGVAAGFIATVHVLDRMVATSTYLGRSVAATAVLVAVFLPVHARVQRGVNRLLYGRRDEPVVALTQLARSLEQVTEHDQLLPQLAGAVAQTLQLPYAAVELLQPDGPRCVAEHGRLVAEPVEFPLVHKHEELGRLLVAPRRAGERFSRSEQAVLEDLARQGALAVATVKLTNDLLSSREQLVRTKEEERRRIRRDLHDSVGPSLAGMTLQVGAAKVVIDKDPCAATMMLDSLEQQLQVCIAEVRDLVDQLNPALASHDLVAAITNSVTAFDQPGAMEVTVSCHGLNGAPLPAAAEVAAYRIAIEAVSNAARHAAATHCDVRLRLDGDLHVNVIDNGQGLPDVYVAGVGLCSMRERAAELGGVCTIVSRPAPARGTHVHAVLPVE